MISLLLKIGLVVFCIAIIVIGLGLSGGMFRLWPPSFGDEKLHITSSTIERLRALRSESKFHSDKALFYPGAPDESLRLEAEGTINALLDRLIDGLPAKPNRDFLQANVKITLSAFNSSDSEERDRVGRYIEEVMAITGLGDSGELLNVWRYGLPFGWIKRRS